MDPNQQVEMVDSTSKEVSKVDANPGEGQSNDTKSAVEEKVNTEAHELADGTNAYREEQKSTVHVLRTWFRGPRGIQITSLLVANIMGVSSGLLLLSLRNKFWSPRVAAYIRFPEEMAANAVTSLEEPFFVASVVASTGLLEKTFLLKLLLTTLGLIVGFSLTAGFLGCTLTLALQPGADSHLNPIGSSQIIPTGMIKELEESAFIVDALTDLFRSMFVPNIIEAALTRERTNRTPVRRTTNPFGLPGPKGYTITSEKIKTGNFIGLYVFSVAIGASVKHLGPYGRPVLAFSHSFAYATALLVNWASWLLPVVILLRTMGGILEFDHAMENLSILSACVITVCSGYFIFACVILPVGYYLFKAKRLHHLMVYTLPAVLSAFGTRSSYLSYPITLTCLDDAMIDRRISRFVFPLATVVSLCGSSIHTVCVPLFLKQLQGANVTVLDGIVLSLLAPVINVSLGRLPGFYSLRQFKLANSYVGIHPMKILKILPMEWIVDGCGTVVNLYSNVIITAIVAQIFQSETEILGNFEHVLEQEEMIRRISNAVNGVEIVKRLSAAHPNLQTDPETTGKLAVRNTATGAIKLWKEIVKKEIISKNKRRAAKKKNPKTRRLATKKLNEEIKND